MEQFVYIINDPMGVHARSATILAKKAKKYKSEIALTVNGKKANIKSMLMIMNMAIKQGDRVTVTAVGSDEKIAIAIFKEVFKKNI